MEKNNSIYTATIWSRYKSRVFKTCTNPDDQEIGLPYWRNILFSTIILYLLPLCLIALVPGLYMAYTEDLYLLIFLDILAVASLLVIAFVPGIAIRVRKLIFCIVLYQVAIALLYYLGSFGPGLLYLLGMTIFVVLIFEEPYGMWSVYLNTFLCILFGFVIYYQWGSGVIIYQYELDTWIAVASNLVLLSALSALLIPKLFNGLQETIEKQQNLQKRLEDTNKRLNNAQQIGKLGYWSFDFETEELYWSDEVYRIYERNPDTFKPSLEAFLNIIKPEGRYIWEKAMEPVMAGEKKLNLQHRIELEDNKIKWVQERAQLIRGENNQPVRLDGTSQDITRMKRLNSQLKEKASELEASNKELEQFAYTASHDLKEPLRMVRSFMELLEKKYEGRLDEKAHKYIHFAVDGATRMTKLIDDLLAYSRVGKSESERSEIDVNLMLDEIVHSFTDSIDSKNPMVKYENLPVIHAVPVSMKILFQNLISNGLKYQEAGSQPSIKIISEELENHWKFAVIDNGIGIKKEDIHHIFMVFKRLHSESEYPGTGMGLAICKKIVHQHGGEIWVESEAGKGSKFYFTISRKMAMGSKSEGL